MNKIILSSIIFFGVAFCENDTDATVNNTNTDANQKEGPEQPAAEESPKEIVQSLFDDYFIPIKEKDQAESKENFIAAIKEIIGKYFDINKIVNTVLGPNKSQFNDEEKQEFTKLFIDKMSIVYGTQFSEFEDINNFEITQVINTRRKRDNKQCCVVNSSVSMKGEKIVLAWFFLENGNKMKIIDIKVAGISLTQNWQNQVKSLFQQHNNIKEFLDNFKR